MTDTHKRGLVQLKNHLKVVFVFLGDPGQNQTEAEDIRFLFLECSFE